MSGVDVDGVPAMERDNPRLTSHRADVVGIDWVRRTGLRWDDRDGVVYTLAFVSAERDRWLVRMCWAMTACTALGMVAGIMLAVLL